MRDEIIIAADCAALLNGDISERFIEGGSVIIGCPLLEDPYRLANKIALVMKETTAKEVEVYTMEVPCCHAIHMMVSRAIKESGKTINSKHYIVRAASREAEPYKPGEIDESIVKAEREAHRHNHH